MLPHFTNIITANTLEEPIYQNLFEITITLPSVISTNSTHETRILLENATNIDLKLTDTIEETVQKFKYSTRVYTTTPAAGVVSPAFDISFNMNQNEEKSVETWSLLKRWYDLAWNSQTGELHYKSEMIGQITANIHDRKGEIIRRVDFINCQIVKIDGGWDLDWGDNTNIQNFKASWVADYWIDTYFDMADSN
jgi:hypothetical protein